MDENDLIYRLRKRAEIRRSIVTRKSVQEGKPDRIADLLEEAAAALEERPSIKTIVDRFLGWSLPENFNPDAGISFKPIYNEGTPYQNRHRPIGTNLLDAEQARQMFEYLLRPISEPVNGGCPAVGVGGMHSDAWSEGGCCSWCGAKEHL
jgi:hypothetical protein